MGHQDGSGSDGFLRYRYSGHPCTLAAGGTRLPFHLAPSEHRAFYNNQRFALNITRAEMVRAGWSPSVRLFEAAACGTPIISDYWDGLASFFELGDEILISRCGQDTLRYLREIPEQE